MTVLCVLGKNVYSAAVGCFLSGNRVGLVDTIVQVVPVLTSLLSTCSALRGGLTPLTIIVDLSVSPCGTTGLGFTHFERTFILCINVWPSYELALLSL